MAGKSAYRTATLKPGIDKAIAKDGAQVVLWGDSEQAVVLRHLDSIWSVTRHPAVGADADRTAARVSWLDVSYAATGERIIEFTDATPLSDWLRFYEEFFHIQQARVHHDLVGSASGSSHAA